MLRIIMHKGKKSLSPVVRCKRNKYEHKVYFSYRNDFRYDANI